jgi:lipopolysaccharide export system permease LptF/LptG-like protein
MRRPGERLRSLAARVCDITTMERLIDPVIADMQCEHADASSRRLVWRCAWVRMAGSLAFWRVIGALAIERSMNGGPDPAETESATLGRILGFAAVATGAVTLMMELPTLQAAGLFRPERVGTAFALLYLIPQAFPIAISVGVLFGILYGIRGRAVTDRVRNAIVMIAVCCTLVSFVTLAWVVPAWNQAFRVAVSGISSDKLSKGANELTLGELRREIDRLNDSTMRGSAYVLSFTFNYHTRLAFSFLPIVFGLFALGLLEVGLRRRSSFVIGITVVTTCLCYYILLNASSGCLPWMGARRHLDAEPGVPVGDHLAEEALASGSLAHPVQLKPDPRT